ncbi:MAG: AraC family transcriptional regulator [Candidatus Sericytochromatia bacterium]
MDILTDILTTAGLKKRILHQMSINQPWSLTFPCPQSIGFHVVTSGKAYLWQENEKEPIILNKGDIAFMSRGMNHYITTHNDKNLIDKNINTPTLPFNKIDNEIILTLVSGAYQLWNNPIHPLFQELPAWYIIKSEQISYSDSLQNCLILIASELENPSLGSDTIINSLLDVLFNMILRRILENQNDKNWSMAFKDPIMLKVLQLMHNSPNKDWTVEELAKTVGLSRSGFALKFKQLLGDTPLNYLTTLRIFKATDLLSNTDYNLEKIANLIGYKDAFSFSKTFKKLIGLSPKAFREKNDQEKMLSWRFS